MTEMVHGGVAAAGRDPLLPRWWRSLDHWTLVFVLALFAIGLLLGLAASIPLAERHDLPPLHFVGRQAAFGALAIGVMLAVSALPPDDVRRIGVLGFLASFAALALLPVLGTDHGKGAVRWFSLGFASIQPSEFVKPGFVVLAAWLISAEDTPGGPPGRAWSFAIASVVVLLLALQPDFGQSALLIFAWAVMWFTAGAPLAFVALLAGLVIALGAFAYGASEHFARRIDGFLDPEIAPTDQLGYAAGAIREGGFFGVGVGEGTVKMRLPDAHTDFIIAVAAEEYGLVLVLVIIALYLGIVLRSLLRAMRERDAFARLAATGLACAFGVQALINMGVAARLLPAKGMTLPFVSYGGSSLIAGGIGLGMLLALTRSRPQGAIDDLMGRAR